MTGDAGGAYWTRTSDPIDVNDVLYQLSQSTKDLCEPILAFCPPRHIRGTLRIGSSVMYISQYVLPTEPCDRSLRHYGRLPQALCTSASMFYQLSQSTKDLCEPILAFCPPRHIRGTLRIGSSVMYISQYVLPTEPKHQGFM